MNYLDIVYKSLNKEEIVSARDVIGILVEKKVKEIPDAKKVARDMNKDKRFKNIGRLKEIVPRAYIDRTHYMMV